MELVTFGHCVTVFAFRYVCLYLCLVACPWWTLPHPYLSVSLTATTPQHQCGACTCMQAARRVKGRGNRRYRPEDGGMTGDPLPPPLPEGGGDRRERDEHRSKHKHHRHHRRHRDQQPDDMDRIPRPTSPARCAACLQVPWGLQGCHGEPSMGGGVRGDVPVHATDTCRTSTTTSKLESPGGGEGPCTSYTPVGMTWHEQL